ncbi:hypothetical protein I3843_16G116900 [Carya illinoinensis]|uniref:Zinc finger PHD-type domain-containing protein n=1 Tax=Carya illinoinensis TaxID=32201 RepID=A0A922A7R5_CARIL|nr:hypothetical protein I3760_16G121200 [Carya illinoinensis]KAG6673596.1 hypothetical protein I3842_16G119500 [Carya illinoinensis]KAG7942688.1 hypothetical protein I3843_16G116900 [Carya illinoinensis]
MVVTGRPLKRMKRRVTADLHDFLTFPSSSSSSSSSVDCKDGLSGGPFRTRVREFLARNALHPPPSSLFPHLMTWQMLFRVGDQTDGPDSLPSVVCLDVVEEDVTRSRSLYCDQCRVVGWSGHPVCAKRFHFIIKADGSSIGGYHKPCMCCGDVLHLSESKKVSVMDVSKKYGLEYRLLHAITKGGPWYGEWGYEFGAGSFALTFDAYKMAVESLSSLPLSILLSQGQEPCTRLQDMISHYQSFAKCELVNIRDLFCFLMSLIHDAHKSSSGVDDIACKKSRACTSAVLWSFAGSDIERVEEAMFRVLRAVSGSNWVSCRALRGAVCKVGPPELLDYCLGKLGGKFAADGIVVKARCNPESGALEYRLEPVCGSMGEMTGCNDPSISNCRSEENLLQDLRFLYESLLHLQNMVGNGHEATRGLASGAAEKLLDCKHFVKDYLVEKMSPMTNPSVTCLSCQVELIDDSDKHAVNPPPELIILPPNATVSDFKLQASKAFQDVYLMFRRFQAEDLVGYANVDDTNLVKVLLGSAKSVRVRGRCPGKNGLSRFRMERGVERWTVDCSCGAKDDDGERMLACDVCGVWQHTRCSGIDDSDSVPAMFVCQRCRSSNRNTKAGGHCKDETVTDVGSSSCFGNCLTTPFDVR